MNEAQTTEPLQTDGMLLAAWIRNRDNAAFSHLGRRYADLVFSVCMRELGDRNLAEDAAQAVFLLLAQKASRLQKHPCLAGWLFGAARLVCKSLRRSQNRRQIYETQAAREMPQTTSDASDIEPYLNDAMARLKPGERDAVFARFFDDQTFAQTGARLGIGENAARMRVARALEKLRGHLEKAGVVVSLSALAALLAERGTAHAAPASVYEAITLVGSRSVSSSFVRSQHLAQGAARTMNGLAVLGGVKWATLGVAVLLAGSAATNVLRFPRQAQNGQSRLSTPNRAAIYRAFVGDWKGTLEYRDYGTDKRVTLTTKTTFRVTDNDTTLTERAAYYDERVDTTRIVLETTTGNWVEDGQFRYFVTGLPSFEANGGTLVLIGEATDDGKPSQVRQTVTVTSSELTLLREVRPKGSVANAPWAFRAKKVLKRVGQ